MVRNGKSTHLNVPCFATRTGVNPYGIPYPASLKTLRSMPSFSACTPSCPRKTHVASALPCARASLSQIAGGAGNYLHLHLGTHLVCRTKQATFSSASQISRDGMASSLKSPLPPAFLISCCTIRPSYLHQDAQYVLTDPKQM